jgi:hypothetical protein
MSGLRISSANDRSELEAERISGRILGSPTPSKVAERSAGDRYDFSRVRVHSDARAAESAQAVNALAYAVGPDLVFGAGQYAPHSGDGKRLLAHELAHVAQWANLEPATWTSLVQRRPIPGGTNYRFDTYQVTASDLTDPDMIARFEQLTVEQLREYQKRITDPQVMSYLVRLAAAKSAAAGSGVDRVAYLEEVQAAIKQLEAAPLAKETLADVFQPMLKEMGQSGKAAWKDARGIETAGKAITFLPRGKGAKKIHLQLVLDEIDPEKEERAGYFSETEGKITLVVRRNPTADSIRGTLYHESLHAAAHILRSQGAAALGSPKDSAIKFLSEGLAKSEEIDGLKHLLALLNEKLNASRSKRNEALVTAETIEDAAKELWEEQVVRAETFVFELKYWMEKGAQKSRPPEPHYHDVKSTKFYLKTFHVVTDADLAALPPDGPELIGMIYKFLMYRQRALIKRHGVSNLYAPSPMAPKAEFVIGQRPEVPLGPMGGELERGRHDPLKEIEKSVEDPVFEAH